VSQGTKHKVERATRSANKKRSKQENVALEDVLDIVFGNGCLHWSAIITLSAVNKAYHRVVKSSPVTKIALKLHVSYCVDADAYYHLIRSPIFFSSTNDIVASLESS
jgi:hypothetical protein